MTWAGWYAVALVLLMAGAASPAAADVEVGLSRDGSTWTPDLTGPLFDPDIRWVPGDARDVTFYVRNQSGDPAMLSLDVLGTDAHSLLDTGDLTVSARAEGIAWHAASTPGTHRLVFEKPVPAGARAPIHVAVTFAGASSNESMGRELDLRFRVNLTQGAAARGAGGLPDTGAPTLWPAIVGAALTAGGAAVLAARRRRVVDSRG